jgi:DNA polymerase III epsilon subunit-like protein
MDNRKNYIFYDLETNGLDYYTTGIMQISILDFDGNLVLNQYVYPYDKRIDGTEIHGIDEAKLINNNAISTLELCMLIKNILREKYNREDVYFIAYNNFGYDQIILENNFKHVGIKMPNNWYFIDFFPIIKELFPNVKPNHKLGTIFENICGKDDSINFHCALGDTIAMYKIYHKINNYAGPLLHLSNEDGTCHYDLSYMFPKYTRSLLQSNDINNSPISSLNGYNKYMKLEDKKINTIGDMYNIFKKCNVNQDHFDLYLRNNLGLYSDFYINNIKKQINAVHNLQKS